MDTLRPKFQSNHHLVEKLYQHQLKEKIPIAMHTLMKTTFQKIPRLNPSPISANTLPLDANKKFSGDNSATTQSLDPGTTQYQFRPILYVQTSDSEL